MIGRSITKHAGGNPMDIRKERMRCTSPLSNVHPIEHYKCMDKAEERRLESRISQLRLRVNGINYLGSSALWRLVRVQYMSPLSPAKLPGSVKDAPLCGRIKTALSAPSGNLRCLRFPRRINLRVTWVHAKPFSSHNSGEAHVHQWTQRFGYMDPFLEDWQDKQLLVL